MKNISTALAIRISTLIYMVLVLGFSWFGFFQGNNREIHIGIALFIFIILAALAIKFIPESRKGYLIFSTVALLLATIWFLRK